MEEDYFIDVGLEGASHGIRFGGGPLALPNNAPVGMKAYGFAAACWARLDVHIEAMTLWLNHSDQSKETMDVHQPRHPDSFRGKIELLRRYYDRHPALAQHKYLADSLFARMLSAELDRNYFLHSVLEDVTPAGSLVLNGIVLSANSTVRLKRLKVRVAEFDALARLINEFNRELSVLSNALFTVEMRDRLQTLR